MFPQKDDSCCCIDPPRYASISETLQEIDLQTKIDKHIKHVGRGAPCEHPMSLSILTSQSENLYKNQTINWHHSGQETLRYNVALE